MKRCVTFALDSKPQNTKKQKTLLLCIIFQQGKEAIEYMHEFRVWNHHKECHDATKMKPQKRGEKLAYTKSHKS